MMTRPTGGERRWSPVLANSNGEHRDGLFQCHKFYLVILLSCVQWIDKGFGLVIWFIRQVTIALSLFHTIYNSLHHAIRLLNLGCLHKPLPGNGSQRCRFLSCRVHVLSGRRRLYLIHYSGFQPSCHTVLLQVFTKYSNGIFAFYLLESTWFAIFHKNKRIKRFRLGPKSIFKASFHTLCSFLKQFHQCRFFSCLGWAEQNSPSPQDMLQSMTPHNTNYKHHWPIFWCFKLFVKLSSDSQDYRHLKCILP
jgi:hypothetical protein